MEAKRATRLAGIAIVVAVIVVALGLAGTASPALPPIAPGELVASTLSATARPFSISGQLTAHVDLGIPDVPQGAPQPEGVAGVLAYVGGDHRIRVWRSAAGLRVSDLLQTSERTFVANRTDAWLWDAETFTARHVTLPSKAMSFDPTGTWTRMPPDPSTIATRFLHAVTPSTEVRSSPSARVAGRDCYVLSLRPRTTETLIGRVEVAIDAERRIPLRVAVFSRAGGDAPLSIGYESVSFDAIDPELFEFEPPEGARVEEVRKPFRHEDDGDPRDATRDAAGKGAYAVEHFGDAWTTVVAVRLDATPRGAIDMVPPELESLFPYSGPLLSARLVDRTDGYWVLYGAVPQSRLAEIEAKLP